MKRHEDEAFRCVSPGRHSSPALWQAYGQRALELKERLALRDVRKVLQGHAKVGLKA